ncbi:MAG: 2,3-bisphosphoglycerate-independent phosphoglycerate mutase [Flavobacteriales bacterium]|nr:2,3-bisphosphoglycerate-independent phosphoglycerate mutase [Flavobacteriales bacterium]
MSDTPFQKTVLLILDGWGDGNGSQSDAIARANTPFVDGLYDKYPHAHLLTSGEDVGLPAGQMGNSEVGHLNIGAGRIVYQDLQRINKAILDGEIKANPALQKAFETAKNNNVKLHLIGLVSDGGVHSHINHLKALCDLAEDAGVPQTYIHAFTDGRDCDPKSGLGFIKDLEKHIQNKPVSIASVIGRYYAMDRDKRWERVREAYDLLVHGKGERVTNAELAIESSYDHDITDEFIRAHVCTNDIGVPVATISEGDVVLCFNFRTDRCREITQALTQQDFPEQDMHKLNLHYVTMTVYDETFKGVDVMFRKDNLKNTLGEVLSDAGKKQIRIAETEKYPHVTFFFSGGREEPFPGEKRIMINSPKVATYDLQPEMSAWEVTDAIATELMNEDTDFVCLNFANPDMVGHTGVYEAIVKAVETIDACVKRVVETGITHGYSFLIIADHGNADFAINDDGTPNTAHTTNPVPAILIHPKLKSIQNGILADVAPTLLNMMGLDQPKEMTGNVLVRASSRIPETH